MSSTVSQLQTITLPVPIKLEHRRGLTSLNSSGRCVAVRMHEDDLALLNAVAFALGITRGEFMRWMCVYGAQAINKMQTGKHVEVTP